ncbi:MAG: proprotein convertase P-domain-containing protein [Pyrinomonadaceae bacterium]
MFLKKYKNLRLLSTVFAVLGLAIMVLWFGTNTFTTNVEAATDAGALDAPAVIFPGTGVGNIPDGGPNVPPDYGAPLNITFNVSGLTANVATVSASVTLTHTYVGDIDMVLTSPGGSRSLVLVSRIGVTTAGAFGDSSNYGGNYIFTDAATGTNIWTVATTACDTNCVVAPGSYRTTAAGGDGQTNPPPVTSLNMTFGGLTPAQANGTWTLAIRDGSVNDVGTVTAASLDITTGGGTPAAQATLFDFTGNSTTEFTTFSNSFATVGTPIRWNIAANPAAAAPNQAFIRVFDYGLVGDSIVPNDYRGDIKVDVTVRRPSNGIYYVAQFPTGIGGITLDAAVPFGASSDIAGAEGDYDGDGKADYTVVRVANNNLTYFMLLSATNTSRAVPFGALAIGTTTQLFRGADFTGDGRDEIVFAQYNTNAGGAVTYFIGDAIAGAVVLITPWGDFNTDASIPPADYTGDRRADLIAVRQTTTPTVWFIRNTATGASTATPFGIGGAAGDFDVRGDYDGDGRHDIAVWRPGNQTFYFIRSMNNTLGGQRWGTAATDLPLAAFGIF